MGKLSFEDKMRVQTLREQGLGAKAIIARYPANGWKLSTVKKICKRVDETGSAVMRKPGSGRPATASTPENIAQVEELICSQEGQSGTHLSTRQIAAKLSISQRSVGRIANRNLHLKAFRRIPVQVISEETRKKRLDRATALMKRITMQSVKRVFFTDEKNFYLNPPISKQNNRVWARGGKADVEPSRLLVEREKFASHIMVSAGVCFGGKGRLHFVEEKAKVNAEYYIDKLLPKLIEDCQQLLPTGYVFQQDGAPAHTARVTQEWLASNCNDFLTKEEWPPNSPDLNPLDYHAWGAMLEQYNKLQPKPKTVTQLKDALLKIWSELPQKPIDKAVKDFRKRLQACISACGRHFEYKM
jgi:transposase